MQSLIECFLCVVLYIVLTACFSLGGLYLYVNEWVTVVCVFVFQCKLVLFSSHLEFLFLTSRFC